jgi:hypothetical protein
MARTRKEQPAASAVDPHAGHGGSYVNAGGVNHDTQSEPARELVERTEHRVVRSAELEEQERLAAEKKEADGGAQPTGE